MKRYLSKVYSSHLLRALTLSFAVAIGCFSNAAAQTTTFAQFFEVNGTNDFGFINNTTSGDFGTVPGGSAVFLIYSNIPGLDPSLQGPQQGHLVVSSTTTQSGSTGGGNTTQPFNQTVTITITRDTPAPPGVGSGSRTNLLTVVITPNTNTPALVGPDGGNSANFTVTTPQHNVTFSSHFISFGATVQRNLSLSFSSVAPIFALGSGGLLQTIAAAGSGTFATDPAPVPGGTTAADVSVGGKVVDSNGRGIANADVSLMQEGGETLTTRTSSFGNFRFDNLNGGQAVVLTVRARRFSYEPRVVSLTDNALDLVFSPTP